MRLEREGGAGSGQASRRQHWQVVGKNPVRRKTQDLWHCMIFSWENIWTLPNIFLARYDPSQQL